MPDMRPVLRCSGNGDCTDRICEIRIDEHHLPAREVWLPPCLFNLAIPNWVRIDWHAERRTCAFKPNTIYCDAERCIAWRNNDCALLHGGLALSSSEKLESVNEITKRTMRL